MRVFSNVINQPQPRHNPGVADRSFVFILLAITVAGISFGYLTADSRPLPEATHPENASSLPGTEENQTASEWPLHRFPLGQAEISDGIETPAMTIMDSGHIVLAWAVESAANQRQVLLTTSHDEGQSFSTPHPVVTTGIHTSVAKMKGRTIRRRMRTLPQLAAAGDTLYLAWVDAKESRESVVLRLAESQDNGATFAPSVAVHQSRDARPTFISLSASSDKTVACSWLDNRNRVQQPFAAVRRSGETEFDLERMVYAGPDERGICPCCPTASLLSENDVLVAFRGHEDGYRDMWVASSGLSAEEFQSPKLIVPPTWEYSGCPHDGPVLCETSKGIQMAWMDGHTGVERIYVKTLGADTEPTTIGDQLSPGITQGHPQIVASGETLHLVWDQSLPATAASGGIAGEDKASGVSSVPAGQPKSKTVPHSGGHSHQHGRSGAGVTGGRAICYATSKDGGKTFSSSVEVAPVSGRFQTRPRICVSKSGAAAFSWMELSEAGKDVVFTIRPSGTVLPSNQANAKGAGRES